MSAGLIGFVGGVGKGMAAVAEKAIDDEYSRMKEERIAENALRMDEIKRSRDVAGAATERTRIEGEAQGMADKDSAGLISSARDQYANSTLSETDKAAGLAAVDAAESGGAYKRAPTNAERLQAKGDYTGAENVKNLERDNSRLDSTFAAETEHRSKTLQETIRHNKQIEANQPEKISPAARAQLEMASTYVTSAHRAEAEAAKALEAGRKDTMASPEKVAQLEKDYQTSKAAVASALKQYDQIGASHFGEQWKKIEAPAAPAAPAAGMQDVRVGGKVIGQASTKAEADALVAKHKAGGGKPAAKAPDGIISGPAAGRPVQPDASDFANVEAAKAARKAKADREEAARTEANRKRSDEIDRFNAAMKR